MGHSNIKDPHAKAQRTQRQTPMIVSFRVASLEPNGGRLSEIRVGHSCLPAFLQSPNSERTRPLRKSFASLRLCVRLCASGMESRIPSVGFHFRPRRSISHIRIVEIITDFGVSVGLRRSFGRPCFLNLPRCSRRPNRGRPLAGTAQTGLTTGTACLVRDAVRKGRSSGSKRIAPPMTQCGNHKRSCTRIGRSVTHLPCRQTR